MSKKYYYLGSTSWFKLFLLIYSHLLFYSFNLDNIPKFLPGVKGTVLIC